MLKKTLSIFFGLFLSLLVLEIFLQSVSFAVKYIKDYKTYYKYKSFKTKNSVTILCIGESTTAGQYPIQLQEALNSVKPGKFAVVDCGIPAITLTEILDNFDTNVKQYNPDIILFMTGINESSYPDENNEKIFNIKKIKIYRLTVLLKMHIMSLIKQKSEQINNETNNIENDCVKQVVFLQNNGKFTEAARLLEKALQKEPDNEYFYVTLTQLYCDFVPDKNFGEIGYKMALKGIDMDFIKDKSYLYKIILEYNSQNNREKLKFYTNKAVNESIEIFKTGWAYFIYGYIKDIVTPEQKKQIFSIMRQTDRPDQIYGIMAIDSLKSGNFEQADKYFQTAEKLRLDLPNQRRNKLYKSLIKKSVSFNIKTICMQYPVRSIEPLKNLLKNEDYFNKIIFISNENNFKEMLKIHPYKDIFKDQFAGDFGHCTYFGNKLIAENAAKTILEEL